MRIEASIWIAPDTETDERTGTLEFEEGPDDDEISLHARNADGEVVASITLDTWLRGWVAGQLAAYS